MSAARTATPRRCIRAPSLVNEMGRLGGIVDSNPETRRLFQEQYPDTRIYNDIKEALDENDGFVVTSPAETHFSIAKLLIENKKPVLVEKPLSLTVTEAKILKNLSEEYGVPLMTGHVLLFHPAIRKIKSLLVEGKIGKLQYIYSNRLNLGTIRSEENILWSFAPHDISIFQYFIEKAPLEVVSRGGIFLQPEIDDTTMTILTYPDNIVGHIFVSWLHPFKEQRLVVIGSEGMLSFEDSSPGKEIFFYEKGVKWVQGKPVKKDGPTESIPYEQAMPLTEELKYFIDRIEGKPVEIANADEAIEVLSILERATQSLKGNCNDG